MKKNLFSMLLSATVASLILVGCNPQQNNQGEGGTTITAITVRPSALTLAVGESTRLNATLEPEGATGTITWTSSDTTVATVDEKGNVLGINIGTANITAKCGEIQGVCAVTVKEYFETLIFTGAFVYDYDTTYSDKIDTLSSENWDRDYYAKKVLCNVNLFSEGFYINDEGYFAGADQGAILEFEAPFYWAPGWANGGSGTIFVLGEWLITDDTIQFPAGETNIGRPYSIDEAGYTAGINDFVQHYYVEGNTSQIGQDLEKASAFIKGATLKLYEYHSTEEGYGSDGYYSSYIPDLVISEGDMEFDDTYTASSYMLGVTYHAIKGKEFLFDADTITNEIYTFGAHFQAQEDNNGYTYNLVDQKVYFDNEYSFDYGVRSYAPAAKKSQLRPMPIRQLNPEQIKAYKEMKKNIPTAKQAVK